MFDEQHVRLGLSAFAAILAVLNPFSIIPVFLGVTQEARPGVRRDMAFVIAIFVFIALIFALFAGMPVLRFFGISIPAFQIAGGILLFSTGLHMIRGTQSIQEKFAQPEESQKSNFAEARARFRDLIVPIGTPLFVGPGSISTVVLYGNRAANDQSPVTAYFVVAISCLACSFAAWIILFSATGIGRVLRKSGIEILSRLMGLILCAISVQFVLSGIAKVMPTVVKLPS